DRLQAGNVGGRDVARRGIEVTAIGGEILARTRRVAIVAARGELRDAGARATDPIRNALPRHLLEVALDSRRAVPAEIVRCGDEVGRKIGIERRVQALRQAHVVVEAERLAASRAGALARVRVSHAAGGLLDPGQLGTPCAQCGDAQQRCRDPGLPRDETHADLLFLALRVSVRRRRSWYWSMHCRT